MFLPTYGYIKYELMPLESYKGIIVKKGRFKLYFN